LEDRARKGVLAKALNHLEKYFDYIIGDAPACLGTLSVALLGASHGVVLTSQCRALSLKSLPKMLSLIDWIQKNSNPDLLLEGIVLTMHNRENEVEREIFGEIRQGFPTDLFFSETIAYDPVFEQASLRSIPVGMMKTGKQAARNYFQLVIEYKEREMLLAQSEGDDDGTDSGLF
jgi:chromosome partitioning protein